MTGRGPTRRAAIVLGAQAAALPFLAPLARAAAPSLRIRDDLPARPISPLIYGSNEIGVMDGGAPSAELDRLAGVTARRLGGNLLTTYNWTNNAANAGKDRDHANAPYLLEALQIPRSDWSRPAVVIEAMHEASLAMGAQSLVTLPIAGHVAADFAGMVSEAEAAPSRRFAPLRWSGRTPADAQIDPAVADMPQLVARLVARYGPAGTPRAIMAYALDNEPGLWLQNHPRVTPRRVTIRAFIERAIEAARAIKDIDPQAQVFGPASWGATEMTTFQNAPDWNDYARYGSFLAAYLDAFREASEREGRRLLDVLDVHWYAFHDRGDLFRSIRPELDAARLDAPRTLTEPGFVESSWVPRAFRRHEGLGLPILPHLEALCARRFPGVRLAVTEFNYGGAEDLAAGLAVVDALGRFGAAGVHFASHWGSLAGWLGEAYRLYRAPDVTGAAFGDAGLAVETQAGPDIAAYAARGPIGDHLIVVNKSEQEAAVDIGFASSRPRAPAGALGFDAANPKVVALPEAVSAVDGGWRVRLPARAARRYAFV
jgi:hypothetical protein